MKLFKEFIDSGNKSDIVMVSFPHWEESHRN